MLRFIVCVLLAFSSLRADDFRSLVGEALRRGEKRIVIPPGNYQLEPLGSGGELWLLSGLKDIEIVAEGVTLTGTKLMRAISLHRCSGVTLRGLTVDYDPLPFTQGEVVAATEDGGSIDIKIHAGYPRKPYSRIDVVDAKTRFRKKGMPFLWGTKAEMVGEDVVRISLPGIGKAAKPGDLASLSTGQEAGAPHAISIDQCEQMHFENVTVHSAPGMGILEADGEGGSTFRHCRIVPGPKPSGATEERLLSSSWDAFQSKTIRKGPLIEDCEITHAGDDSWSVQSSDFLVVKCEGTHLALSSRDEFTSGVQTGDRLRANVEGPEWKIVTRQVMRREKADLAPDVLTKLEAAKTWDAWKASPQCIVVTLDHPAELKPGDSVYSPDRMGNGFIFRRNHMHSPGRVLIKAGGLMEDNVLDTPHALVICPEVPSGAAAGIEDLVLRRNVIKNGGWFCPAPWSTQAGIISFTSSSSSSSLRDTPVSKNVLIENNILEGGMGPHLIVSSVQGLTVRGNRFVKPLQEAPPETGASFGIPRDKVVWITRSSGVTYEKNKIEELGPFAAKEPVTK
ncbi:hypothetical protein [Brevifollis gellanilyticus]|uniref:Right handed beta helix domain-containing protein n=1 Tax=Brevifollis gellanilyticus TaxID=748831 RepID=A0A512M2U9_9BACT|nr:hypothetical protein [Brevifollis gellanilyticus]GEP41060.1 hypothetical protein BGE01nite_03510 [Brevifollis gellanilyticus]